MNRGRRRVVFAAGIVLLFFGLGCLNFTEGGGVERHRAWAHRHGLPEPSRVVFLLGVAGTTFGAALTGFAASRGASSRPLVEWSASTLPLKAVEGVQSAAI